MVSKKESSCRCGKTYEVILQENNCDENFNCTAELEDNSNNICGESLENHPSSADRDVEITLDLKIKFLEEVVVPSFSPRLDLRTVKKRDIWSKIRSHKKGFSRYECEELMLVLVFIESSESAQEERTRLIEKRAFIRQQHAAQSQQQAQAPPPPPQIGDDLSSDMANLEITEKEQQNASSFCSTSAAGFGFLPTYIRFDPTIGLLTNLLVPTPEEIEAAPRLEIFGETMGLQSIKETVPNCIEDQFVEFFNKQPKFGLVKNGRVPLKSKNLEDGIASSGSYEDSHHTFGNDAYLSVIEHTGAEASAFPALSQAAVTATNFALGLLKRGVPRQHCIVPVIGHSGITMVIGATIVLEPSFPTFIPLSKHLDISDPQESKAAFAFIKKTSEYCLTLYKSFLVNSVPDNCKIPEVRMALDLSNNGSLFIKTIDQATYQRGIGLFARHNHYGMDVDCGIQNMMMSFNELYNSPARPFVEFPLSIRTPDSSSNHCYQLIYRNLKKEGFVIGTPNRITHEEDFDKYRLALKDAVAAVHAAGVLHVDLYLSNIMWKKNGDEVQIKIIDWDASHRLSQHDFHPNIRARLENHLHLVVKFGPDHDNLYLSVLDLEKDLYIDYWIQLSTNDKKEIDKAFFSLLSFSLDKKGL